LDSSGNKGLNTRIGHLNFKDDKMVDKKNSKGIILAIFGALFIIFSLSGILAEDFCFLKMGYNQKIPITTKDYYTCKHTICQVCATNTNPHWYASWNKCRFACTDNPNDPSNPENQPLVLTANFPFADGGVFTKQNFLMDITTNKIASISMQDNIKGTVINFCPNCARVGKSMTFRQGFNDITIRASKGTDFKEKRITFFIDNQKPQITKTYPLQKKFTDGTFTIVYNEDGLTKIDLFYGAEGTNQVRTLSGCEAGKKKNCSIKIDLTAFNEKQLTYYFTVYDKANNVVSSKPILVYVDMTAPKILSFSNVVDRSYVNFQINVEDKFMDKIIYYDNEDMRPKTMCSSMRTGLCNKKLTFRKGHHVVKVQMLDKAGNKAEKTIEFDIA
jgi:hypothetical protein